MVRLVIHVLQVNGDVEDHVVVEERSTDRAGSCYSDCTCLLAITKID